MAETGYYLLVQYCPDHSRAEVVNVGVVLFCPGSYMGVLLAPDNKRVKRFFGQQDWCHIDVAKLSMKQRLLIEEFKTVEELKQFAETRANDLFLTSPRPIKVFNHESDLQRLFDELVENLSRVGPLGRSSD